MAWHFGSDTGTGTAGPCGMDFYLGRLGYSLVKDPDWTLPVATSIYAFPYWNVTGPHSKPASFSAVEAWGKSQEKMFHHYYVSGPPSGRGITGKTMFGSIDTDGYQNTSAGKTQADAMLTAFFNELHNLVPTSYTLGIYGAVGEYNSRLHASWTPPQPLVVWEANSIGGGSSCATIESEWSTHMTKNIGSYIPMIWQYQLNPDHNVTKYNGGPDSGVWTPTT